VQLCVSLLATDLCCEFRDNINYRFRAELDIPFSSSFLFYSNTDVSRLWTRPDTSRLSNSKWSVPLWDWLLFWIPLHYKRRMQESFKRLLLICSVTYVMIPWFDLLDRNIEYLYLGSRRDACQRNPCHNGGTCSQTSFEPGYRCRCEGTGYYGNRCQHGKLELLYYYTTQKYKNCLHGIMASFCLKYHVCSVHMTFSDICKQVLFLIKIPTSWLLLAYKVLNSGPMWS
jgi:hypothetical protein